MPGYFFFFYSYELSREMLRPEGLLFFLISQTLRYFIFIKTLIIDLIVFYEFRFFFFIFQKKLFTNQLKQPTNKFKKIDSFWHKNTFEIHLKTIFEVSKFRQNMQLL